MRPGPRNAITDVEGLLVGHAEDERLKSGVTVLTAAVPFVASVHVMGGAPGTRETDLLAPDRSVQAVDALVLAGGSAFGLAACDGVVAGLRAAGRGFAVGAARVPIVPGAILFDLLNGGDKAWDDNPYPALGRRALETAGVEVAEGSVGVGCGATTATLKGGLGTASAVLPSGITIGALVAVNAVGAATIGDGPHFWAAPFEIDGEFGGRGPGPAAGTALPEIKGGPAREAGRNTSIAIVATDAALTKAQAARMAVAAHDGLARALVPCHTPMDGDLVFAAATGARPVEDAEVWQIGHAASVVLARAVARGIHRAHPAPGDPLPCWQDKFGSGRGRGEA